jgi:hypothetical protein
MKNKIITRASVLTAIILLGIIVGYANTNYPISLMFRDAQNDLFRSDGKGPYVHGVNGITCLLNDENLPERPDLAGDLSCYDSSRTNRSWCYPTNPVLGGYNGFCSTGQIRVKSVRTITTNGLRGLVLRASNKQFAGNMALFDAEVASPGSGANHLAFIEKLNECQYRITFGTDTNSNNLIDIYQGTKNTYRSTVPLPFQMVATIVGC